jgi:hypothetical protein
LAQPRRAIIDNNGAFALANDFLSRFTISLPTFDSHGSSEQKDSIIIIIIIIIIY